jgi:DNA-binding HxlR family transcriptional regulator
MRSGFGQFCPVAVACEVFAERWTPIIVRELLAGADQFNLLHRGIPRISRPLLAKRLRALEKAGVIQMSRSPAGRGYRYQLTEAGKELGSVIQALGAWGQRWTVRVRRENLDAGLLMWNIRRGIALERLPSRRVVARFSFTGAAAQRGHRMFWLLLQPPDIDLCVEDPGHEVDLYVEADLPTMANVWLGDITLQDAIRHGRVRVAGPAELRRAFPGWLMLSRFASVERRPGVQV